MCQLNSIILNPFAGSTRDLNSDLESLSSQENIPEMFNDQEFNVSFDEVQIAHDDMPMVDEELPHDIPELPQEHLLLQGDDDDHVAGEGEMTYKEFVKGFIQIYLTNGSVSKNAATKFWKLIQNFLSVLKKSLPSSVRGLLQFHSFQAELDVYMKILPKMFTDYILLEKGLPDSQENYTRLPGLESFPASEYPPSRYKLLNELTYVHVKDLIEFMSHYHEDKNLYGRDVNLGWDLVPVAKSNSFSLSTIAMALRECHRKPLPLRTSKSYVKSRDFYTTDELLRPVIQELNEGRHNVYTVVADKPCRDKILNHKNHKADYPCEKCPYKAYKLPIKRMNHRRGRLEHTTINKYPYKPGVECYTDAIIRDLIVNTPAGHDDQKGFIGYSCIVELENFDLWKQISLDSMHLTALGMTKKKVGMTYSISHDSISTKELAFARLPVELFNRAMLKQRTPSDFNRRARSMDFANFKAEGEF